MSTPEITPEQREAAKAVLLEPAQDGNPYHGPDLDGCVDALIAAGWGPVADAEARCPDCDSEMMLVSSGLEHLSRGEDAGKCVVGTDDEPQGREWEQAAKARGYRAGIEAAAAEVHRAFRELRLINPGTAADCSHGFIREQSALVGEISLALRALADKPEGAA